MQLLRGSPAVIVAGQLITVMIEVHLEGTEGHEGGGGEGREKIGREESADLRRRYVDTVCLLAKRGSLASGGRSKVGGRAGRKKGREKKSDCA